MGIRGPVCQHLPSSFISILPSMVVPGAFDMDKAYWVEARTSSHPVSEHRISPCSVSNSLVRCVAGYFPTVGTFRAEKSLLNVHAVLYSCLVCLTTDGAVVSRDLLMDDRFYLE